MKHRNLLGTQGNRRFPGEKRERGGWGGYFLITKKTPNLPLVLFFWGGGLIKIVAQALKQKKKKDCINFKRKKNADRVASKKVREIKRGLQLWQSVWGKRKVVLCGF